MKWLRLVSLCALPCLAAAQNDPGHRWNDQGLAATARGDFPAAEALFHQALERWRALGPSHDAHYAVTEVNLAQAQCGQGHRKQCEETLKDSLAIFRRTLGMRNERTLANINLLGGVALMQEDSDYAEQLFDEALPIERQFFPHDLELASTLGGLASLRSKQSKSDEALSLGEEALKLTLETAGEDSVDAALEYTNLAEIHRVAGQPDRALPLYRKAEEIYGKILGTDHPRVACILSQEGLLLMQDHKYAMAEDALLHARQIIEKTCPQCGLERSLTLRNLGMLRLQQDRLQEADRLLTEALAIQSEYMVKPGAMMAITMESLAQVRKRQRRFEEAERLKSRAAVILAYR